MNSPRNLLTLEEFGNLKKQLEWEISFKKLCIKHFALYLFLLTRDHILNKNM